MYADSSHANARYCYSGGYRYFCPVENSTGCIRLNKMQKNKTVCGSYKRYPGVEPGTAYAASTLSLPGFPGV